MDRNEAKKRIEKLKKLIDYNRDLYHTFDSPQIDDAAFDTLKNELAELERKFPDLVLPDSPTQKIGGKPLDKFEKVRHEKQMLSFNDAFSEKEMDDWLERLKNYLGKDNFSGGQDPVFYCELKIDGLAIELVYENSKLVCGSTRGDGIIGEDVTQNLLNIKNIPRQIEKLGKFDVPKHLVVRGEVFISRKEFEKINKNQEKLGLKPYANTRNLAAGSIRQLDPGIVALRNLDSFQYDIVSQLPFRIKTHEEKHQVLSSWGFKINLHNQTRKGLDEVFEFRNIWEKKREKLEYEIDGVVVILNDNNLFEKASFVGKAPRGAIAYKFSPRQATTIVEDVVFQVGRTGAITPVAVLRPVEVSGVTISHATLHNFDEIERLGLKINDTVIVTRSGDVIPKITQVIVELRDDKRAKSIKVPQICPVDGSKIVKEGVLIKCSNPNCGSRNRNSIIHFASRNAFDIRGLGDKIVDRFLDEGLISGTADIFKLKEGDIASLERFGEKSAKNLIGQIEKAKKISLSKLIYALGVPQIGQETAATLSKKIIHDLKPKGELKINRLLDYFREIKKEELEQIQDVGPKVSESIKLWFAEKKNQNTLRELENSGVNIVLEKEKTGGKFKGLNMVITGSLKSMPRPQAKEVIEKEGGHFQSDITLKTDVVIAGDDPGSKYKKAKEMNIEVWDERQFIKKAGI